MKHVKLDDNAHSLLVTLKEELLEQGIENPTISEAVRILINDRMQLQLQNLKMKEEINKLKNKT